MYELIFIIFCYILLGVALFYIYISNYSTALKAPFYLLFILLITYVTYVAAIFWAKEPTDSKDSKNEDENKKLMFDLFQRFFIIYGEYILIIIGLFIVCAVFYNIFMGILVFTLSQSIWTTLGLIILVLALLKNTMYNTSKDSEVGTFIKDLIFYIPCLITDAIDFIKKDYAETPNTTFIVFVMILVYCAIFFLPSFVDTDGGVLIINEPKELNVITAFSTQDILLNTNYKTSFFSDKTNYIGNTYKANINAKSDVEFCKDSKSVEDSGDTSEINKWNTKFCYLKPTEKKTQLDTPKYKKDKLTKNMEPFTEGFTEPFTGILQQDTSYDVLKPTIDESETSEKEKREKFDIIKLYKETSDKISQYWNSLLSKIFSGYNSLTESENDKLTKTPYKYNYGLSFWLYINTFHFKQYTEDMQQIVSYGNKLSLKYDNKENVLVILLEDKEVYRTKAILYQRWNHIVINSGDNKLDFFVNNNLVGTYKYQHASIVNLYDSLIIGSTKNINFGSICNFRYYDAILELSNINYIYRKYNNKSPPIG
jgi:hypothetical protein